MSVAINDLNERNNISETTASPVVSYVSLDSPTGELLMSAYFSGAAVWARAPLKCVARARTGGKCINYLLCLKELTSRNSAISYFLFFLPEECRNAKMSGTFQQNDGVNLKRKKSNSPSVSS